MRTVATAGHVDHGKSSLVYALTGTDPDRFTEEKTRGLTIDLGFAFTTLPSGCEIGFVDVPGHVRFIKNMLAGVGAVEVALFVVAATEGWMPQSEEHLRILELLGVRHGMVALTKADLVDPEMLELAQLEVGERLARSPLATASVVVCDSVSGRGLDEVRSVLDTVLAAAPAARDLGRPRLWVDRVFAMKGAGTIVTGTLTGGSLALDDELRAGSHPVRVRGIETAGERVDAVDPGARVALNLAGIDHRSLRRGDAVVRPDQWRTPTVIDVAVVNLPGEDVKRRGRLQAAVGSGEHRVWFRTLGAEGRFARLRFDTGLPLAPGDRLVLRDAGRRRTLAGAEVLDVSPARRVGDVDARLGRPLGERLLTSRVWLDDETLGRDGGLSTDEARVVADDLVTRGVATRVGRWVVDASTLATLRTESAERVLEHHRRHPAIPGWTSRPSPTSCGSRPRSCGPRSPRRRRWSSSTGWSATASRDRSPRPPKRVGSWWRSTPLRSRRPTPRPMTGSWSGPSSARACSSTSTVSSSAPGRWTRPAGPSSRRSRSVPV